NSKPVERRGRKAMGPSVSAEGSPGRRRNEWLRWTEASPKRCPWAFLRKIKHVRTICQEESPVAGAPGRPHNAIGLWSAVAQSAKSHAQFRAQRRQGRQQQ